MTKQLTETLRLKTHLPNLLKLEAVSKVSTLTTILPTWYASKEAAPHNLRAVCLIQEAYHLRY
jgi:hypothetical protein